MRCAGFSLLPLSVASVMVYVTEDEVDKMLARLVDQVSRIGLTVEKYLASHGKTSEQLRSEYENQAEQTLKLEMILSQIADQQKVTIKDEEVEKMIKAVPDQKTQKTMDTPAQRAYIRQLLRKRGVIDSLLKL